MYHAEISGIYHVCKWELLKFLRKEMYFRMDGAC